MPGVQFFQQIDMNGLPITEVAPGVAPTDAVNVSQLNAASPQGFAQDVGDGVALTYNVVHNFGTLDVMVQVFEKATNHNVLVDAHRVDANTVQVGFGLAPALNSYRVLVIPVP
ncbi:MAG TPA: hypothetical protein VF049_22125 [Nocardioidaceae bacterium]